MGSRSASPASELQAIETILQTGGGESEVVTVKEIAAILKVSSKTVEFHKSALMDRLDIHTTAELTRYAIGHGLVAV